MSKKNYILLGIIASIMVFAQGYFRLKELRQANKDLVERIDDLARENKDLAHQVERLKSDPFYIEKIARDKMGIGKEGEVRYTLVYEDYEQTDESGSENR